MVRKGLTRALSSRLSRFVIAARISRTARIDARNRPGMIPLHRICMPNIAPCCLTAARGRRSCRRARPLRPQDFAAFTPDSRQAWVRLALALLIGSIGSVGMWSVVVVLPVVQAEFGATRGAVSLAFTLTCSASASAASSWAGSRIARHRHGDRLSIAFLGARLCAGRAVDHALAIRRDVLPDRARARQPRSRR